MAVISEWPGMRSPACTAWLDCRLACSSGLGEEDANCQGGLEDSVTEHGVTERGRPVQPRSEPDRSPVQSNRSAAKHAWDVGVFVRVDHPALLQIVISPDKYGHYLANGSMEGGD